MKDTKSKSLAFTFVTSDQKPAVWWNFEQIDRPRRFLLGVTDGSYEFEIWIVRVKLLKEMYLKAIHLTQGKEFILDFSWNRWNFCYDPKPANQCHQPKNFKVVRFWRFVYRFEALFMAILNL